MSYRKYWTKRKDTSKISEGDARLTKAKPGIQERANKGEYELVLPLDARLMEELPPEGTMFADLYLVGGTVNDLQKKFPQVPKNAISARIRSLHVQGMVTKIRTFGNASAGWAWQRTARGSKVVKSNPKEKATNGNKSE